MSDKLWQGRFSEKTAQIVESFTSSIQVDRRLDAYDIQGSIAHCKMLAATNIISRQDADKILSGLDTILSEIEAGSFTFKASLEDIHMNVEARLAELIGEPAGRLHTARSAFP